ncbi:hypothetical protein MM817_01095 [Acidibacillus sp. S0AB]|uniref:MurNAc-LAA domain-containing protein n=1 Tax=Sulfoacidibacillus ferrooxidans TaxID=2005001 RepID=A0A9X1V789_9BACL|nr:hypothetical protein [Sulfoacidibacillus ferrooxidans]
MNENGQVRRLYIQGDANVSQLRGVVKIFFFRRSLLRHMVMVYLVIGTVLFMHSPQSAQAQTKVVVIDPGHGGVDGGASGAGLIEKDVTLDLSKRIRAHLVQAGYQVQMTRDTDTDVSKLFPSKLSGRHKRDLQNRLDFIRKSQAVGALMIHINSSTNVNDRGPIVFYYAPSESGKTLATNIQHALNQVASSTQRPLPRKNFFVLRHSPCTTVLIEVGFLTNNSDAARLRTTVYREHVARAIAMSVATTLRDVPVPPPYVKKTVVNDWLLDK